MPSTASMFPTAFRQAGVGESPLRPGATGALGVRHGQGGASRPFDGDVATLSDHALDLSRTKRAAPADMYVGPGDTSTWQTVTSLTTASGRTLEIQGRRGLYRMNVLDSQGEVEKTVALDGDVLVREDESGNLVVENYVKGDETAGDDIIIATSGEAVSGGDGDDQIISLGLAGIPSLNGTVIDAGAGNDSVFLYDAGHKPIGVDTGDGDDRVTVSGGMAIELDTGNGDDTITGASIGGTIDTGAGDDVVDASSRISADIDTGDGDDSLRAGYSIGGTIETGAGEDELKSGYEIVGTVSTGSGRDRLDADNNINAVVDTGEGDDVLGAAYSIGGNIVTGDGNDHLDAGYEIEGRVDTGNGDDFLGAGYQIDGYVQTGDGGDVLEAGYEMEGTIDTGEGNDFLDAGYEIEADVDTGAGSDVVRAGYSISGDVDTGEGSDVIRSGHEPEGDVDPEDGTAVVAVGRDAERGYYGLLPTPRPQRYADAFDGRGATNYRHRRLDIHI